MKYGDFKPCGDSSRYVRVAEEEKRISMYPYKIKELVLITKYPGNDKAPEFKTKLEDKDKYVLVVNETLRTAFPVLRSAFWGGRYSS